MKTRVITALVSIVIFLVAMLGYFTPVLNVLVSIVIGIAVWELFSATGLHKHKLLYLLSTVYACSMPFLVMFENTQLFAAVMALYAILSLAIALKQHQVLSFDRLCVAMVLSTVYPLAFLCLLMTREVEPLYGIYYIFIICGIAWGGDSFAYFGGRFFGKHKLAPIISPKKTVEGVYGGIFGSILIALILSLCYSAIMNALGNPVVVRYAILVLAAILLSLVSVFGDLVASMIKRQFGIKDYGKIFPGHGGIMDRFDSVLMVAPIVYFLMKFIPVILPA